MVMIVRYLGMKEQDRYYKAFYFLLVTPTLAAVFSRHTYIHIFGTILPSSVAKWAPVPNHT
ncbi:hypothetical protein BCR43DRAFT_489972 [Syncephalastrum racemosum]|uniref:Uncharacterized protein n=1 Tax=Syncephalastrum racemosum TaxID=13706 RepID=A0A1X2HF53_SYNRA|nr:hypothetical protein BCR43DRAFT_489972 [Syncephalastrum racemosum]